MAIVGASGYGVFSGTPLCDPQFFNAVIANGWAKDIIGEITDGKVLNRVTSPMQPIQFVTQVDIGDWHPYLELNQEMIPDKPSLKGKSISVCNMAYKKIKLDLYEKYLVGGATFSKFENMFLEEAYRTLSNLYHTWVFQSMVLETPVTNKGNHAGQNRSVNLGSDQAPVRVTASDVIDYILNLYEVLQDSHVWSPNDMFLVVPSAVDTVLRSSDSPLASCYCQQGAQSVIINGQLPSTLHGFKVYQSPWLPQFTNEQGEQVYTVIAGHRNAFAFYGDIIEGNLFLPHEYPGMIYRMVSVYGGGLATDKGLAVGKVIVSRK